MILSGVQDITFDGRDLTEFGCVITEPPDRPFPKRRYDRQTVYGRSGDLIVDSESYDNITITYRIATVPGLYGHRFVDEVLTELKAWLCSSVDYKKLYDSELPDGFYYAFCSGISNAVCTFDEMYEFSISFSLKPYFYFDAGQKAVSTSERTLILHNSTDYAAEPVITLFGNGLLGCNFNGRYFIVKDVAGSVRIDCEAMSVYSGGVNKYDDFSGLYPALPKGNTTLSFTGTEYQRAEVIPRWRRL